MITGLMCSGNVHHSALSRYIRTENPRSAIRRIERFFQKQTLVCVEYATAVVHLLQFRGKFFLCLDRTNWKFGQKNLNYLVLSWRINKKISIPLFFVELDKAGNSGASERQSLLDKFDQVFGFDRIASLCADREFIGTVWFKILIDAKIPFYIRCKENGLVPYDDEEFLHLRDFFQHLKPGELRIVEKEMYGSTVYFAGTRADKGDLVIIISNQDVSAKKILDTYRKRWSIEELFKKLKTSGFHWENTHMKLSSRLETLLIIMSLGALFIYHMGIKRPIPWKKKYLCPLRSLFRQGLINFQHLAAKGLKFLIRALLSSLKNLNSLLELPQ